MNSCQYDGKTLCRDCYISIPRWPSRRESMAAPRRTSSVHSARRWSFHRMVGTEMLIPATICPVLSYTPAATQPTASLDSQSS